MPDPSPAPAPPAARIDIPDGVWPVMVTPFRHDGAIDWPALDALIEFYLDAGSAGLFAVCQSSEMFDLDDGERMALATRVVDRVAGRVPVVASGTFGNDVDALADTTRRTADTGVDAVVCLAASLATEGEDEATWQRRAEQWLARTGDIPLGLYECPKPYHRLLAADTLAWAATTGRFLFLKETSCRLPTIEAKIGAVRGTPVKFFNANAATLLASLEMGGRGFSGISLNFVPELWAWLCRHWRDYYATAARLQAFLAAAETILSRHYPLSAKHFLALRGLPLTDVCRLPVDALTPAAAQDLEKLARDAAAWREELDIAQDTGRG